MVFVLRNLFLWIMVLLLSSCGFHLRGALPLAPQLQVLYLKSSSPYGQFTRNLREYLKASGVELTESPATATTVLNIISESVSQELLSVSSTQQTRQYNLRITVTFQILSPSGKVLSPSQQLTETRFITIQSDQILGGSNEANSLFQQIRQALAFDMMNRLASKDVITSLQKNLP